MKFQTTILTVLCSLALVLTLAGQSQAQPLPEAPEAERKAIALDLLKKSPNAVLIYAKGLCCQSCGIGVRKKVTQLTFVDQTRYNSGVELHPKSQLATIAIKAKQSANPKELSKAIDDAGYDPVSIYSLKGGKLVVASLALKK
jgi:copper chaperone CopZ